MPYSHRAGDTQVEFFMDEAEIRAELPRDFWQPVFLQTVSNLRTTVMNGRLVFLFGLSKPNEPMGNLMLITIKADVKKICHNPASQEASLFFWALKKLEGMCEHFKIKPDNDITEFWKKN